MRLSLPPTPFGENPSGRILIGTFWCTIIVIIIAFLTSEWERKVLNLLSTKKFIYPRHSMRNRRESPNIKVCFSSHLMTRFTSSAVSQSMESQLMMNYGRFIFFNIAHWARVHSTVEWAERKRKLIHISPFLMLTHFMSLIHDYQAMEVERETEKGHELFIIMNIYDLIRFSSSLKLFLHLSPSQNDWKHNFRIAERKTFLFCAFSCHCYPRALRDAAKGLRARFMMAEMLFDGEISCGFLTTRKMLQLPSDIW